MPETGRPDLEPEPTRSAWEQEWPPFANRYGLPAHEMNVVVLSHRIDVLLPGLNVMLDGWRVHGSRHAFEHDREESRRSWPGTRHLSSDTPDTSR